MKSKMIFKFVNALIALLYIKLVKSCVPNGICGANPLCQTNPTMGLPIVSPSLASISQQPNYGQRPLYPSGPYSLPSQYRFTPQYGSPTLLSSCATNGCNGIKGRGSYACGRYGCYRTRIQGSTIFQPSLNLTNLLNSKIKTFYAPEKEKIVYHDKFDDGPINQELLDLLATSPTIAAIRRSKPKYVNPNRVFMDCCMDRQLPDACLEKCNYKTYTKESLIKMYFQQDSCPLVAMREIQFCAAQGADHRNCCQQNGVAKTLAGKKCLTFCNQRPGQVTQLDMTYIPCFERFDSMKNCFYYGLNKNDTNPKKRHQ